MNTIGSKQFIEKYDDFISDDMVPMWCYGCYAFLYVFVQSMQSGLSNMKRNK